MLRRVPPGGRWDLNPAPSWTRIHRLRAPGSREAMQQGPSPGGDSSPPGPEGDHESGPQRKHRRPRPDWPPHGRRHPGHQHDWDGRLHHPRLPACRNRIARGYPAPLAPGRRHRPLRRRGVRGAGRDVPPLRRGVQLPFEDLPPPSGLSGRMALRHRWIRGPRGPLRQGPGGLPRQGLSPGPSHRRRMRLHPRRGGHPCRGGAGGIALPESRHGHRDRPDPLPDHRGALPGFPPGRGLVSRPEDPAGHLQRALCRLPGVRLLRLFRMERRHLRRR